MEHQNALAKAIRAHFETSPVGRKRVLSNTPRALVVPKKDTYRLSRRVFRVVLAVIEDYFEKPIASLAQIFQRDARRTVAVVDALEVAVG